MAEFRGNEEEFTRFVGPSIRNRIQKRTVNPRKKAGRCQSPSCLDPNVTLQSAHVRGESRPMIIRKALEKYMVNGAYVILDLGVLEQEIWEMHLPLEAHFRWLCKTCHRAYDRKSDHK